MPIDKIQAETGININKLALDAGYDAGAVHRGLELLGIEGYVTCIPFNNDISKRGLKYIPQDDCFKCQMGKCLNYAYFSYKKSVQSYNRIYRMSKADRKACRTCKRLEQCAYVQGESKVNASSFYPAFYRNRQRYKSQTYQEMKLLREIWSEGTFAVLKREHNLSRAKKRGLLRVKGERLLSAVESKTYCEGARRTYHISL